ncbi:hypothetical protein E4T44_00494 [Aureobasidium sp. EXF-8845]|nr:hypothetical protein E4T44_00494 [Aureobasidium sp. EXF-8845]KAI4858004.1 hypothetical protein E4T45_00487 [Aureobasidium sp. EXF-8846]
MPASAALHQDESPVFLSNTQDAWTALDSQLFASSQLSDHQSIQESDQDERADDMVLQLPIDSSLPPRVSTALPPDESSLLNTPSTRTTNPRSFLSRANFGTQRHGQYISSPLKRLPSNEHESPSYLDGLSTVHTAETPVRRVSILRTSDTPLPQDDYSSPSDEIPSQLPSTYSLSDINSDPIHSDQNDAPTSSVWGSLPKGSAPQPWNGIIEEESPLKGIRSFGKRRAQVSSPLKQTQSLGSSEANMSSHVKPAVLGQDETSSASLDRVFIPKQQQQHTEPAHHSITSSFELRVDEASTAPGRQKDATSEVARSSFESRFSSEPQAQGTPSSDVDDPSVPVMLRRQVMNQLLPTSFESRFSSSPEAQGTPSSTPGDIAALPTLKQPVLGQLAPTSFESRFSSSPEAHGTPFVQMQSYREQPTEASSSPSSKIDLFQPRAAYLPTTSALAWSSAVETNLQRSLGASECAAVLPKSSLWRPSSSASEASPAVLQRAHSDTAIDFTTPLNNARFDKPTAPSSRVPESSIVAKKRKFASFSTPKSKPNTQEKEIFKSLSIEIHPPPPPTGSKSFVSHITPQLSGQFWDSEELQGKYKPFPHRVLRQSERGYWQFDTRAWSHKIQIKFWIFLQSNIGSGVSGWGIWCLRENELTGDEGEEVEHELGIVKVFCWGEVVGHVWLLCYVASQARLKRVESQWVDADGEVVVRI